MIARIKSESEAPITFGPLVVLCRYVDVVVIDVRVNEPRADITSTGWDGGDDGEELQPVIYVATHIDGADTGIVFPALNGWRIHSAWIECQLLRVCFTKR